jgi:hypothetical protein
VFTVAGAEYLGITPIVARESRKPKPRVRALEAADNLSRLGESGRQPKGMLPRVLRRIGVEEKEA